MVGRHIKRIITGVAVLGILALCAGLLAARFTDSQLLSVQSGSMAPAIEKGDLVAVKPVPHYQVGDVITFINPKDPNTTITHRVISVDEQKQTLQTKGDANNAADYAVAMRSVVGKVNQTVPYAGTALDFIRQPVGLFMIVYIPALIIIGAEIRRLAAYYRKHGSFLAPGRKSYAEMHHKPQPIGIKLGAGLLVGGAAVGLTLYPVYATIFSRTQLTGNTINYTIKTTYQVCNFPETSTLLSYALIDVFYPELPDPPIVLGEPIIPGTYKITAVSNDEHIIHPNAPTQPNERWYVQLYGEDLGAPIHSTGVTDDIPNDIDQTTTVINEAVTFAEPVTAIRYVHNAFLTGIEKNNFGGVRKYDELTEQEKRQVIWNSVHPGCITFERVPPNPPTVRPEQ